MIVHQSPITMPEWAEEPQISIENGWALAKSYKSDPASGVGLIDLSHRPKAIVCGPATETLGQLYPGQAKWTGEIFICCRKPGERIIFDITGNLGRTWPDKYYTDLRDAWGLFALIGQRTEDLLKRLIPIDFEKPDVKNPSYAVVRCHGIWVQLLDPKASLPGIMLACERSHCQNLVDGLFRHGRHLGLQPTGLRSFEEWLSNYQA